MEIMKVKWVACHITSNKSFKKKSLLINARAITMTSQTYVPQNDFKRDFQQWHWLIAK